MKNKKWKKAEREFLLANYSKLSNPLIASKLRRTVASVFNKAKKMGLEKPSRKWSDEDYEYLFENYAFFTSKELSEHFGTTPEAVRGAYFKIRKQKKQEVETRAIIERMQSKSKAKEKMGTSIKAINSIYGIRV